MIWSENDIVVSMSFDAFLAITEDLDSSPHGNFKPQLEPRLFDSIVNKRKKEQNKNAKKGG